MRHKVVTIVLSLFWTAWLFADPDAQTIIQRSVASNEADWKAAPEYSYTEEDHSGKGSRTYEVTMVDGSPYRRLIKVDGEPLSHQDEQKEQRRFDAATRKRKSESAASRQERVAAWVSDRQRDHILMEQLSKAFDFTLTGQQEMGSHDVFVLRATPRPGYAPPNREARVLLGMEGELWVDTQAFQWVKVTAKVIHPVSIAGFLARVEPGTDFELEKAPVAPGIWLPTHFAVESRSRILDIIGHRTREDQTYSGYHRSTPNQGK
ncbi:MAG TPA: hypothetical protein VK789_31635 [Bryobacteraceae bacterium]|nr:hypothetical protein [Bryobacteraceae bacterium]